MLLNEKQQEAVNTLYGPVMVFAGAGSGKTRTLTYRIANMIDQGINPSNILAITFTNKATEEMKGRLRDQVGISSYDITISTFHSLCARILRKEIYLLGYTSHFNILDEEDQLSMIRDVLEENNIDKKLHTPKHIKNKLNYCKCFRVKSEIEFENFIFDLYEKHMKEANTLDFEDLLIKTYELFSTFPEVLEKYRNKFKYILVDEFQDTNTIQYDLLKMLAEKHRNLFVVGDDDQSIYSFRGTNYENMKSFKRDFSEYKMVILNQNYRSTQSILDGCNKLIGNNVDRQKKDMFSEIKGSLNDITVYQARDHIAEVDYVIDNIKKILKTGVEYKDIAILYRSSVISRNFELGLINNNIPYRVYGGFSYLRRREIKDVIAYLKLIVYNDDIISFKRVINSPSRKIGEKTIQTLLDYRKNNKLTLFQTIDESHKFLPSKYEILQDFKNNLIYLRELLNDTTLENVYNELLDRFNYVAALEDDEDKEDRIENINEFRSILVSIDDTGEVKSRIEKLIDAFDDAILSEDKLRKDRENNGVILSTVHSVKGLEFNTVFLVAFEDRIFPNLFRFGETVDIEEERRIAYVACSRAKQNLFLTCTLRRLLYGEYKSNRQSQFLIEFVGETKQKIQKEEKSLINEAKKEKFEMANDTNYKVGDKVRHDSFGEGIVVSIDGNFGTICFLGKAGIKTFNMSHPAISKI